MPAVRQVACALEFDGSMAVLWPWGFNTWEFQQTSGWWCLEPWNFFTFHSVGNFIIPTDFHAIIFQRGRAQPPTRHGDFRSKLGFKPPFFSIDGSWRGEWPVEGTYAAKHGGL